MSSQEWDNWLRKNPWFGKDLIKTYEFLGIATVIRKKTTETGLLFMKTVEEIWSKSDIKTYLQ